MPYYVTDIEDPCADGADFAHRSKKSQFLHLATAKACAIVQIRFAFD